MPAPELHRSTFPALAASTINANAIVSQDVGDTQRQVLPVSTCNVEPLGQALATAVNPGDAITVLDRGSVVKQTAMASVGAGAYVGVASTNGAVGLITGASGVVKWAVGKTVTAAAAGETFSYYINPIQLGGLA